MSGAQAFVARTGFVAIALACLVAGPDAHAGDARTVLSTFLSSVSIRHGVAHGSLVVMPIVLNEEPPAPAKGANANAVAGAGAGLTEPAAGIAWRSVPGSDVVVELTAGPAPAGRERFLPTGTLLLGGERERMVAGPVPLRGDESAAVGSVVCDSRKKAAVPVGGQRPGAIAPLEQRKVQSKGEGAGVLTFVQQIQCCIAQLPVGTETIAEVLQSTFVTDGVRERMSELSRVPKAYGGLTVGHVAFFGFRPVEVVAYSKPSDYQALGPAHLRSLAASHVFWSNAAGDVAAPAADADVRRLAPEALAILQSFARMQTRPVRPREGERSRWALHAGDAETDVRAGGRKEAFDCRFALDEKGRLTYVEAIESGDEPIYPPPYREPGGRPVGEPPSNKGNGDLSPEALQRLLERILRNREKRKAQNAGER